MKINLSPIVIDAALTVSKVGDLLTINGVSFDFSSLPDGGEIPGGVVPCPWIEGRRVSRVAGEIELTLILPIGPTPSNAVAFPAPIFNPPDVADRLAA